MCRAAPCFVCTHPDVKDPDEVGPLRVVFDQTGDSTAPLHPAAAPVCAVHLDHRRAQSLDAQRTEDRGQGGEYHQMHST